MGAGLIQLISTGHQDQYLIGNPQITFFKNVYYKYLNFSSEIQEMYTTSSAEYGQKLSFKMPKTGDLLYDMFLDVTLPDLTSASLPTGGTPTNTIYNHYSYVNGIGYAMIKSIDVQIGTQTIDKQYGEWLELWSNLTVSDSKQEGLDDMVGKIDDIDIKYTDTVDVIKGGNYLVPLSFWFCNNPGLALPLIALSNIDVYVNVELQDFSLLWMKKSDDTASDYTDLTSPGITKFSVKGNYIYVDTAERLRLVNNQQDYLVTQVQKTLLRTTATSLDLTLPFLHPVTQLVWRVQRSSCIDGVPQFAHGVTNANAEFYNNDWLNFSTTTLDQVYPNGFYRTDATYDILSSSATAGSTVTVTLTTAHSLLVGDVIVIAGATDGTIDGTHVVTVSATPAFGITVLGAPGSGVAAGTVTYTNDNTPGNLIDTCKITVNNLDLLPSMAAEYYSDYVPYRKYTRVPTSFIYAYSFALQPENINKPTGSLNFSGVNTVKLDMTFVSGTAAGDWQNNNAVALDTTDTLEVVCYAVNYNVLRIVSGQGSVLYMN